VQTCYPTSPRRAGFSSDAPAPHARDRMSAPAGPPSDGAGDDPAAAEFAGLCVRAVTTAARDLHLDPEAFADELAQGEIGLLIRYLDDAAPHVGDVDLRARIDALLHRLTAWTGERG